MKILQFGRFYPPSTGGIETVIYTLTEMLNQIPTVQCDVLCSNLDYSYQEEHLNNYIIYRTKTFGIYFSTSITIQMIFKLRAIIDQYDIIHVHLPDPMANLALFFTNTQKQKIVLHWHSDIIKQKKLLKLYEPLQRWLMNKADRIIASTPKYIDESKYLQSYKNKCLSIPYGIDPSRLQYDTYAVEHIKHNYHGRKIIFSLGRLVYYKGFEYLIHAAKYLSNDYCILIGGTGPLEDKLKKMIIDNNITNKVFLLGKIDDENLGNFYQACDLFCLPSIVKAEAFGIVQIEAMSFSKPVVATKIKGSGVDWVNKDEISGINVECRNPKALADAFVQICEDKYTYQAYCSRAQERFSSMFNADTMITKTFSLYNDLLSSKRPSKIL